MLCRFYSLGTYNAYNTSPWFYLRKKLANKAHTAAQKTDTAAKKAYAAAKQTGTAANKIDTAAKRIDTSAKNTDTSANKNDTADKRTELRRKKLSQQPKKNDSAASKTGTALKKSLAEGLGQPKLCLIKWRVIGCAEVRTRTAPMDSGTVHMNLGIVILTDTLHMVILGLGCCE